MSRSQEKSPSPDRFKSPYLSETALWIITRYTPPRTRLTHGKYAAYQDKHGEWVIGYGSRKLHKHFVGAFTRGTHKEITDQFIQDLEPFAELVRHYVQVPLNRNKRAAVLSYAHSVGIPYFKECRLLKLINDGKSKKQIIREWSPYINTKDLHPEFLRERRRTELNLYLSPDKDVPLLVRHNCKMRQCLLNLAESYIGSPNQVKAIEYLENKLLELDPGEEIIRRFFRYWNEKPSGQLSAPRIGPQFPIDL